MKTVVQYLICFLAGAAYCTCLTFQIPFSQNASTIIFVLFLTGLFSFNLKKIYSEKPFTFTQTLTQLILINLGIGGAAFILKSPESYFWVQDSVNTHLPESIKYLKFFKGEIPFSEIGHFAGVSTHLVTSLFLGIFGINTLATILAQLFFKIIALTCLYSFNSILWNKRIALVSIILYGLCPTVFFYNLVLYKESAVQAYFAASLLFTLKIFIEKKYWNIIPLIIALLFLLNERFYISYVFVLTLPYFIYKLPFRKTPKGLLLFLICVIVLFIGVYSINYKSMNNYTVWEHLQAYRQHHQSFSDVLNHYNYEIPYPLAFVKILFSPYFTVNKFKIFNDFSTLLIWGSPINQIIIAASVMGLWKAGKQSLLHVNLWIPFILFLIAAAYISPWSGRLRDSFYPLIASYAAFYLVQNIYFKRVFRLSDNHEQ